ncbi:MAG: sulfurtransferase [Solirubrobacteraceae bacterium]
MNSPLLSVAELAGLLDRGGPATLLDVRWELGPGALRDRYQEGHIPGAAFVDLDRELSAPPGPGGRHPLPPAGDFAAAMRRAGVVNDRPVVVYDAANSLAAARAWWLLRFHGHADVRVLDGGLAAWSAAGGRLASGSPKSPAGDFQAHPGAMSTLDAPSAAALAGTGVLLDARAPERFRGEVEPIDPVGGHIPGAHNLPMAQTLEPTGRFLDRPALRAELARAGVDDGVPVGAYCGSGITAAHTVLALELAGFGAALYPGSWSEWVTDSARPVATGAQ